MPRKPVDTAHEVQRSAERRNTQQQTSEMLWKVAEERDRLLVALRALYDETQDWEDALGDERPSLVEARANAAKAFGGR